MTKEAFEALLERLSLKSARLEGEIDQWLYELREIKAIHAKAFRDYVEARPGEAAPIPNKAG